MAELAWSDACNRVILALRRDWGKPWKSPTQAEEAVTFYIEGQGDSLVKEPKYWDDRKHLIERARTYMGQRATAQWQPPEEDPPGLDGVSRPIA